MTSRTTSKTITFKRPFALKGLDDALPAGDYIVDTDEDLIQGISFNAYRRVSTIIYLPDISGNPLLSRSLTIDPNELDAALKQDTETT
jgi:hypothetical protein